MPSRTPIRQEIIDLLRQPRGLPPMQPDHTLSVSPTVFDLFSSVYGMTPPMQPAHIPRGPTHPQKELDL